jgi:hypothetical protein
MAAPVTKKTRIEGKRGGGNGAAGWRGKRIGVAAETGRRIGGSAGRLRLMGRL